MSDDSTLVQHLQSELSWQKRENKLLREKNQELLDRNDEMHTELVRVAHFRNLLKTLRMVVNEK